MIKINHDNLLVDLESDGYQNLLEEIKDRPIPDFEKNITDLGYVKEKAGKYGKYKNIILISNGGSRTSAWAFYYSLSAYRNDANFEFLSSCEPELISGVKKKYSPDDTLVLIISKSGDNINALEPLISLIDYPVLAITGEKENVLSKITKARNFETIIHPEVGGRFSGMTNCGLVPAFLMGLPIGDIYDGAKAGYEKFSNQKGVEENDALKLALHLYDLEKRGYTEIFTGIYSTALFGFFPLLVQLIHESTGKGGLGQTIFGDYSPESQHHTNQRFFGGRKNVLGLFMGIEKSPADFSEIVPDDIKNVTYKDTTLGALDGVLASDTMKFDMQGVVGNAVSKKIPVGEIWVDEISPKNMGEFMVFWHYFTMYSAYLRGQNPFDQPEVEAAKVISFDLRIKR